MDIDQAVGTQESYDKATENEDALVRLWLDALSISSKEEENWRKRAQETVDLYRQSNEDPSQHKTSDKKFNILHSNVDTTVPALYNSTPIPDVRRRYGDPDPIAKTVCDILERAISYSCDSYDFDQVMNYAVKDEELAGRGTARIRYLPYVGKDDTLDYQEVKTETVAWKHFRRGPGYTWDEMPWIAFELFLTREELEKLSPDNGSQVGLDVQVNGINDKSDGRNVPEVFKRARVWEIWDKDRRQVLFIAESFKEKPIRTEDDPLGLEGFFPIPRPMYAVQTSASLVPVVPYDLYKAQAEELERVSERIVQLTEAVKARALYDARMSTEMERMEKSDDADNVPIENIGIFADGSKLSDHIMWYPIDVIVGALEKLYLARDQIKAVIYETTGISDILRGETDPNETLGAQQIKTQWGSLRVQRKQAEVARFARDIFRIKAEIFATKFEPKVLEMMTGIPLVPAPTDPPEVIQQKTQVLDLLRTDALRGFRVDVESDSTIRADMTRNQQNMSQFLQGTAQFAQAMGPIVMTFKEMTPAVVEVYSAFARNFKLGKQAEDALDAVADKAKQMSENPQPETNPQLEVEKMKAQNEAQKMQAEAQFKQQEHGMKLELMQADVQKKQMELQMQERKMALDMQAHQQKMVMDAESMERETAMEHQRESMAMERTEREHRLGMEATDHKHQVGMEMMDRKAKQQKAQGSRSAARN